MKATRRFDAANYISTPEQAAAFLDEALKTGDPDFIAHALGTAARAMGVDEMPGTESGDPRLSTLVGVLKAMALEVSITNAKAA